MGRITREAGVNAVTWKCEHGKTVRLRKSLLGILLSSTLSDMYIVKDGCDKCRGKHPNLSPGWESPRSKLPEKATLISPQNARPAGQGASLAPAE